MRFACPTCHSSFQTAPAASAPVQVPCASCGAEMQPAAEVLDLHRLPTRRYDLHELQARLEQEREALAQEPEPDQIWFVGIAGRKVGPLTAAGLEEEVTDPDATRPDLAQPRERSSRAEPRVGALSGKAPRPVALRFAFVIALLGLAMLFAGRTCAPAQQPAQSGGGPP